MQNAVGTEVLAREAFPRTAGGTNAAFVPGFETPYALRTGAVPTGLATGDFNHDGHMDFAVTVGVDDQIWVYLGRGDGTFNTPVVVHLATGDSPVALVAADFRGTGNLDLVAANADTNSVAVFFGNGDGTFDGGHWFDAGGSPLDMIVGDFNGDGKKDLFLYYQAGPSTFATMIGDGQGGFAQAVFTGYPCCFGDEFGMTVARNIINDGHDDAGVAAVGAGGSAWLEFGDQGLYPVKWIITANMIGPGDLGRGVTGVAFGDVAEDGCIDAVSADTLGTVWLAKGACGKFPAFGPSLYATSIGDTVSSMLLADVNGDGHLDLVTGGFPWQTGINGDTAGNLITVSLGNGDGTFGLSHVYRAAEDLVHTAVADFNDDGKPDIIAISQTTDTAVILFNDGAGGFSGPQGVYVGYRHGYGSSNAAFTNPIFKDVTGDGLPDMVELDFPEDQNFNIGVTRNIGNGRFGDTIFSDTGIKFATYAPGDYKLGDFNGDGIPDVLFAAAQTSPSNEFLSFMPGHGDGTFGPPVISYDPAMHGALGIGDFDGDGKQDFILTGLNDSPITDANSKFACYLSNGDGTFRLASKLQFNMPQLMVTQVYVGDFNHDGKLDVLAYFTGNGYWVTNDAAVEFLGNGDGTFQGPKVVLSGIDPFDMADVNGDGLPDIIRYSQHLGANAVSSGLGAVVYLGQADGSFNLLKDYEPYGGVPAANPLPFLYYGDPTQSSLVADYNGDGIPDIMLAYKDPQAQFSWMQVMEGNGDGTFTPTYVSYDLLRHQMIPRYAADLDNDGVAELIELDGERAAMHVIKAKPAPALQLFLNGTKMSGDQGQGTVVVNLPSDSGVTVNLTSSDPAVTLPSSISIPAGASSQTFNFSVAPSFDATHALEITAELNGDTDRAWITRDAISAFTFTASADTIPTFYTGQTGAPITLTAQMAAGVSGEVQFACGKLPYKIHCQVNPATVTVTDGGTATTQMTISSDGGSINIVDGYYDLSGRVEVTATAANQTMHQLIGWHTTSVQVILDTDPIDVNQGSQITAKLQVRALSMPQMSCGSLPAGVTCSFDYSIWTPIRDYVFMTVQADKTAAVGPSFPTVTANVDTQPAYRIQFTINVLPAPDFSMAVATNPDWTLPGEKGSLTLQITPNSTLFDVVTFSCTSAQFTCTGTVGVGGAPSNATVQLVPNSGVTAGTYPITVTGTTEGISHSVMINATVVSFSAQSSTGTLALSRGGSGTVNLTVTASAGYNGNIKVLCVPVALLNCSAAPAQGTISSSSPFSTVVTIAASPTASLRPFHNNFLVALALPGLLILPTGWRYRRLLIASVFLTVVVATLCLNSCGGGGGSSASFSGGSTGGGGTTGGGSTAPTTNTYTQTIQVELSRSSGIVDTTVQTVTVSVQH